MKLLEFFEAGTLEPDNLRNDPGETTDRAGDGPGRAKALHDGLRA